MKGIGLFTREFLNKMEDMGTLDWTETIKRWSAKFKKIGRRKEQSSERESTGYSSSVMLTQQ